MGVILGLLAFLNKLATDIIAIVLAVICLLFSVLLATAGEESGGMAYGIYVMVFGCLGCVVGPIMAMIIRKKESNAAPAADAEA